ncbi:MAG: NifU family protein [Gemmatimonadota bacterium]|jgi:Fe-S cluster biogenesis protein NfuA
MLGPARTAGAQAATGASPPEAGAGRLAALVRGVIERTVNPSLEAHDGWVRLVDVQDGVARIEMGGGCQGCAAARLTLRGVIERMIRRVVPEVARVEDVTRHEDGTRPFLPRRDGGDAMGPTSGPQAVGAEVRERSAE